jgi:hypothetical protein
MALHSLTSAGSAVRVTNHSNGDLMVYLVQCALVVEDSKGWATHIARRCSPCLCDQTRSQGNKERQADDDSGAQNAPSRNGCGNGR